MLYSICRCYRTTPSHAVNSDEHRDAEALHQAAGEHARRQLAQAQARQGKDREALEQELQELRLELTQAEKRGWSQQKFRLSGCFWAQKKWCKKP